MLVAAFAVLGISLWLFLDRPAVVSRRLADGTTVTLLGVTYGRQHEILTGSIWQRLAWRLLPAKAARRLGIASLSYATTNETLIVWAELRDLPGPNRMTPASLTLSDGLGTEFRATAPQLHSVGSNRLIQGTAFSIVPRGSARLHIAVTTHSPAENAKQTALFDVVNPAPRLRPKWQATAFPIEGQSGDLKLVLTRLRSFEIQTGKSAESDTETWMRASCYFSEGGTATTNWQVTGIEVLDEAGGRFQPFNHFTSFDSIPKEFEFHAGLGSNAVWKLRFTLIRVGGFLSNQVATVRRLPRPAAGSPRSDPVTLDLDGLKLSVSTQYSPNLPFLGHPAPVLVARTSSLDEDLRIIALQVVDQDGMNVGHHPFDTRFGGVFIWTLRPEEMTEYVRVPSINATLAVSRLHYVELLVRPEPPSKHSPSTFPDQAK